MKKELLSLLENHLQIHQKPILLYRREDQVRIQPRYNLIESTGKIGHLTGHIRQ
jgi:hypothetical protein